MSALEPALGAPTPARRLRLRNRLHRLDRKGSPYLYISPFFLIFAVFGLVPLVWTAYIALTDRLLFPATSHFIGLDNFAHILHDPYFWNSVENTLAILVIATVPELLLALLIAHVLNAQMRARTAFRMVVLIPQVTSLVAVGTIFNQLFGVRYGLINYVLHEVGIGGVNWTWGRVSSWIAIATMIIWRWTGYNALIYLAGMQAIPDELYEAAAIDGASRWKQFIHVTIPMLRPTILFTVILGTIGGLQVFTEAFQFGGVLGGADRQFQTIVMYLYEKSFGSTQFKLGYASAIGWVLFLLVIAIGTLNYYLVGRISSVETRDRPRRRRLRWGRSASTAVASPASTSEDGTILAQREAVAAFQALLESDRARGAGEKVRRRRRKGRVRLARKLQKAGPLTYIGLTLFGLVSIFPLYWSLVVASHDYSAMSAFPPALLPGPNLWHNIKLVFTPNLSGIDTNFWKALANSTIVASIVTVLVVFFSALAGFAFAKLHFRGRRLLLLLVIGTMIVPPQVGVIPLYIEMIHFGWVGHLQALIFPALAWAFGVFLMRQYIMGGVPDELIDSARVDGCNTARVFWHVVVPAVRPALAVLALLAFMGQWNDFYWPLVVLNPQNPTVQVAVSSLQGGSVGGYVVNYSLVLTATFLSVLPMLVLFLVAGRQIVGGIMKGAVKG